MDLGKLLHAISCRCDVQHFGRGTLSGALRFHYACMHMRARLTE
ncbi:hypothetical protein SCH4B_2941 [Ruegeria sp. TrichCH4B]|nr:hypothetical protein SCH4B_2941 [Ruegeria sp. TrichCH4B]